MKWNEVTNIELAGVSSRDYPEFCDAFIVSAECKETGRQLTDEELDKLTDDYPEEISDMAYQSLI